MAGRYVHEKIKKIDIAIPDEYGDDMRNCVEDPIQETAVAINITINRYINNTQSSAADPTGDLELDDSDEHLCVLDGFLDDDVDRWDELNDLVHHTTITIGTLRKIKKAIRRYSSRIKQLAWQLKTEAIGIEMTLDLLTWYDDQEEEEEDVVLDDDFDEEEMSEYEEEEEEMIDIEDDTNDVKKKPALRSSVEALDTKTFKKKKDLEIMLKSISCRSCGICLDEFSVAGAKVEGISIKTMPCLHIFHIGCIDSWLENMNTCPICRYEMPTAKFDT